MIPRKREGLGFGTRDKGLGFRDKGLGFRVGLKDNFGEATIWRPCLFFEASHSCKLGIVG